MKQNPRFSHRSLFIFHRFPRFRPARTIIAVVVYLVSFGLLLLLVSKAYLIPALVAKQGATAEHKKVLQAYSLLVMAVLLFVLLMGLLITFRIGRFFFPRRRDPMKPTQYVDAWKEAGRRMQVPEENEDEDEEAS